MADNSVSSGSSSVLTLRTILLLSSTGPFQELFKALHSSHVDSTTYELWWPFDSYPLARKLRQYAF